MEIFIMRFIWKALAMSFWRRVLSDSATTCSTHDSHFKVENITRSVKHLKIAIILRCNENVRFYLGGSKSVYDMRLVHIDENKSARENRTLKWFYLCIQSVHLCETNRNTVTQNQQFKIIVSVRSWMQLSNWTWSKFECLKQFASWGDSYLQDLLHWCGGVCWLYWTFLHARVTGKSYRSVFFLSFFHLLLILPSWDIYSIVKSCTLRIWMRKKKNE